MREELEFDKGSFLLCPNKHALAGLSPQVQVVAIWIADYGLSEAFPSMSTLSAQCGMSESSVRRAINELVDLGLLVKRTRFRENGSQTSNAYSLVILPYEGGCHTDRGGLSHRNPHNSPNITLNKLDSKESNGDVVVRTQRSVDIDECFAIFEEVLGMPPMGSTKDERFACNSLLQRKGMTPDKMRTILMVVRQADSDRYKRFSIGGFVDLRNEMPKLMAWAREKSAQGSAGAGKGVLSTDDL